MTPTLLVQFATVFLLGVAMGLNVATLHGLRRIRKDQEKTKERMSQLEKDWPR